MFFRRQTLLLVCLVFPLSLFAQPVANDDNATAIEGESVTVDLVANDTPSPGLDAGTVDLIPDTPEEDKAISTEAGDFVVNTSGVLDFTPTADFDDPAVITYTVKDATLAPSNEATVTINITPVNDPPTISLIDNTSVNQDASTPDIPFQIFDVDNDVADLDVTAISSDLTLIPTSGFSLEGTTGDRTIAITPAAGESGSATITVSVTDGDLTANEEFDLEVIAAAAASPVIAISGPITTAEDTPSGTVTITVTDADTPPGSLTLTPTSGNTTLIPAANVSLVEGVSAGTWTLAVTPAPDQNGTTQIDLLASDGAGNTDSEPVSVTVTAVNDAPTVSIIDDVTIPQGGTTGSIDFTIDDKDGLTGVTVSAASNNPSLVLPAGIVLGGEPDATRTIAITPVATESGAATITVTVSDGEPASATEAFVLNVTPAPVEPPVIAISAPITTAEDTPSGTVTITVTDADTPVGSLSLTATSANTTLIPAAGVSLVPGPEGTWTLSVTPAPDQNGTTQINLVASDGAGNSDSDPVSVTVTAVNDAPTISTIDDVTIPQGGTTGAISFTIADKDGFTGVGVSAVSSNAALVPPAGIALAGANGNRTITITPLSTASGTTTITVTVSDGPTSATEVFVVEVTPTPVAPPVIAISGPITTAEDTPSGTVTITVTDADTPVGSLSLNATSANTTLIPAAGVSLVAGAPGTWTLAVTPAPDLSGTTQINLVASDGAGNSDSDPVSVTVTAVNDAPTISTIDDVTIPQGGTTGAISFTIADKDGFTGVGVSAVSSNAALVPPAGIALAGANGNRTITITPLSTASGTATITVTVSDGPTSATETFVVAVTPTPVAPPVIAISGPITTAEDTPSGTVTITVTDADTPAGSLSLIATSANTTLIPAANVSLVAGAPGTWTLAVTPAPDRNGTTQINLVASDGAGNSDSDPVSVTVTAVNDAPTISTIDDVTIPQGGTTGAISFTIADKDGFTGVGVSAVSSNAALVPPAGIALAGANGNRTITITPLSTASGTATITVTVSDGPTSATETFVVAVTPTPVAPPVIAISGPITTAEDTPSGTVTITVTDADTPAGSLSLIATSANTTLIPAANVSLVAGAPGTWTLAVTPAPDLSGTTQINLVASDGAGNSDSDPVSVTVTAVNDAPTISTIDDVTIPQGGTTGAISFTIADKDGFTGVGVSAVSSNAALVPPAGIALAGANGNRTITITPLSTASGTATITVTVSDGPTSATETFVVEVTPTPVAPPVIAISGPITTTEDTPSGTVTITVTDADTPAGSLSLIATSANTTLIPAANVSLVAGAPGTWTLAVTPAPDRNGTTQINLVASDGAGNSDSDPVSVTVTAVNDAPTITSVAPLTTAEDVLSATRSFTVADAETAPASLNVTAVSGNTTLIPDANITLTNTGVGVWSVQVMPAANQNGSANVTLRVSDGDITSTTVLAVTVTSTNDLPTLTAIDNQSINQNTSTAALGFTVGDTETDPASLVMTATSGNAALVPVSNIVFGGSGPTRNVTITPAPGLFGTAAITLTVTDANAGATQSSFQLTVLEVNAPPFFVTTLGNLSIDEDLATGSLSFEVGDPNTPVNTLAVTGTSSNLALVDAGGIAIGGTGATRSVTITPNINANGVTNITLRVSDGSLSADMTFVLTVNSVNDLPTITSIAPQNINENTETGPLGFTITDLETAPTLLTMSSLSTNTTLADNTEIVISSGGSARSVNVIPKINRSGVSTITLTVTDANGGTAQSAFLLSVAAVDAPPTISSVDDIAIAEDTPGGVIPFTVNDIDIPAGDVNVTGSSSDATVVAQGGITLVETGPGTWTVQITPVTNASGSSLITLTANDGTETTTETFTVTVNPVNDLPTITPNIPTQNINEDSNTGAIAFAITDLETPVGSLNVTTSSTNETLVPAGSIVVAGSGGSRTITVTPVANLSGSADITIHVTDLNGGEATQTFTVNVSPMNDAPTISAIGSQNINEDGSTGDINFTVGDDVAGTLTVTGTSSVQAIVADAGITISSSGTARTVSIVPVSNAFGTTVITLTVTDAAGLFATSTFNVVVAPVNDVPTISTPPAQTIVENASTGAIPFTVGDLETAATSLTVTRATSNTAVIPLANVVLGGSGVNRTVTVSPMASQSGTSTITLTVTDGTTPVSTTFDVNVTPVEDVPSITVIADRSVNEDEATPAIAFTIADPDTPIGSLAVTATSDNQSLVPDANVVLGGSGASRSVTVTPLANQNGTVSITITVTDGTNVVTELFVLTVTPVNDAPTLTAIANQTINEDTPTGNIGFTVADLETATTSLVVTATSDNSTLVPNTATNLVLGGTGASRTIQVVPAANTTGTANITVTVNDGTTPATRTFSVTISPMNDAPTISVIADQTLVEDAGTGAIAFTIGDEETPATLNVSASSGNTTLIPVANIVLGGSGTSRTVTITPALNQSGTATISIIVDDATSTTTRDFVVTVTPVDDSPTISAISNRSINEDVPTGNITFTISDPETAASALTVTGVSSNATLVPTANIVLGGTTGTRTVNISPAANASGTTNITLTVSDGANTVDRVFTVNVTAVNDLPSIQGQEPISVNEGQPVTLNFTLLHVVDPDNTQAELTILPIGGANYSLTGPTTITPNPSYNGPLTVPVLVSDGNGVGPLFNVAITVISTNDPPVITGQDPITMAEDQTLVLQVTNFDITDPDSDPANRTLIVMPGTNYSVGSGNTITPAENYSGLLTVIVKVNDGTTDSAPFNASVTVTPVNDPPTITGQTTLSINEETPFLLLVSHFTVADLEPSAYILTVMPAAADAPYTTSGNQITAKADVTGPITVPVRVSDGLANSAVFDAQVTVIPVNDAPVITGQTSLTTIEDIPITVKLEDLVVTDVDNANFPTGFTMTVLPGTNYTFTVMTVTPALDFVGELQVNVQVSDGVASSAVYPLRIAVTDDADAPVISGQEPISMNEDTQREITMADLKWEDSDSQLEDLVPGILEGTNYTFEGATLIPNPNFFGTLTVNVRVFDGEAYSNPRPIQVTVVAVDDPASFNPLANITVFEDAPQQTFQVTGITAGPMESAQLMSLDFVSDNTALIPHPNATPPYSGYAATATVAFKPVSNAFGTATVTVTLVDSPPPVTKEFTITVTSVNDAPTLTVNVPGNKLEMAEGSPTQTIDLSGISPGGGAPEAGQLLSFIVRTDNNELFEVVPQAENPAPGVTTATLQFKAKENAFGTAHITVRLQDSGLGSPAPNVNFVERTFELVITPVNDPPVIVSTPIPLAEPGKEYHYELVVTDADNDDLVISATSLPSWATLVQGANGHATISGVPPVGEPGKTIDVGIIITDEAGTTADGSYKLSINSRPILTDITLAISEDTQLPLAANDFDPAGFDDPDGNPIAELQILTLPLHGVLKTAAGELVIAGAKFAAEQISTLNYEPIKDFFGVDTLRWTAADGFFSYAETVRGALLTIQVAPVNDLPVFTMEAETDTLEYELGSELEILLTRTFDCWDPDGDLIKNAEIGFKRIDGFQYRPENDMLNFNYASTKISGSFNNGVLVLSGPATQAEYDSAIRHVTYQYVDAQELLLDTRSVYIQISDGVATSVQHSRIIQLIYTFEDLQIPSAFSPNEGDNVNQTWSITSSKGDFYPDAEIKVFNKNGQLLFEARGLDQPWTGIYNGTLLPTDTYYYTIDLHYNKVRYKGAVTLLR